MWPPWSTPGDDEPPSVRPLWATCPRHHTGAYRRRRDGAIWCDHPGCGGLLFFSDFAAFVARLPTVTEAA